MARMNWSDYEGPGFNSCWFAASASELNCLKSTTPSRCVRSFCETDENMTWRFNSGGIFPTSMSTVVFSLLLQPWPFFAAFLSSSCICNFQIGLNRTWRAPFHGWEKRNCRSQRSFRCKMWSWIKLNMLWMKLSFSQGGGFHILIWFMALGWNTWGCFVVQN